MKFRRANTHWEEVKANQAAEEGTGNAEPGGGREAHRIGPRQQEPGKRAGQQADAGVNGIARRADRDRLAIEADRAAGDTVDAEDRAGKLGAAGANQPRHAEDLAGDQREVERLGFMRLGPQARDLQDRPFNQLKNYVWSQFG